jgi:hypothetical protein
MKKNILILFLIIICFALHGQTTKKFSDYPVVSSVTSSSLLLIRSGSSGNVISTITKGNLLNGYLTSETSHTDVLQDGDFSSQGIMLRGASGGTYSILTDASANWNTAYGWGNHAIVGYLTSQTSHTDVVVDGDFASQGIMLRGASSGSYSILTNSSTNWNTAYTDRLKWDGGSTGLTAATGRSSLGGTTVGQALFMLTNPSAVTFPRINANNTVDALSASNFLTAIGGAASSHTQAQSTITALSDSLLVRYTKTQINTIINDTVQIVGLPLPYLKLTPSASPPGGATEGMIYADTDHHLYYYNGSTWVQLDN